MDDIKNLLQKSINGLLSNMEQSEFEYKIDTNEAFRIQVLAELALMEYLPEPIEDRAKSSISTTQTIQQKATDWKKAFKKRFDPLPYLENLVQQTQLQLRAGKTEMLQLNMAEKNAADTNILIFKFKEVIQQSIIITILNNQSEPLLSDYIVEAGKTSVNVDIFNWLPGKYYLIAGAEGQPDFVISFYVGNNEFN